MRILMLSFVLLLLILSSCATSSYSTGSNFDSSLVDQIVKGKTNKDDLTRMFGQPFSKTVMSGNEEKWIYMYSSGSTKAQSYIVTMKVESTGQQKMLDILLQDGIVINFTYNEGPMPGTMEVR